MNAHAMLVHHTRYRYDRPVHLGPQTIRLHPVPDCPGVLSYSMDISPTPHGCTWEHDPFGNRIARVTFTRRVTHFDITIRLATDQTPTNPFHFTIAPAARLWPAPAPDRGADPALAPYLQPACPPGSPTPLLDALVRTWRATLPRPTLEMLVELTRAIATRVTYRIRLEAGVWSPEETLRNGAGSCRDSAWLLIAVLRGLGVAARFVSGYLLQPRAGAPGQYGGELHAWAQAYVPGAGWIGLDTTSGLLAAQGHVPLAVAAAPHQAAPVSGLLDHCVATFEAVMETIPLPPATNARPPLRRTHISS
ncbi:transglutaminase family protein [Komagataeibacter rhaeticus]|uniref:Transglutaminase family protein n=1 Tax=Komagataeibacter rhaeticus TaxID=215221 RepID=A0A181C792_9PROT|nr:transglutaminase family protein [Komagataeibacter rhaeticus]ATU73711.1 transglutaminase family protein [Komagataeibacter xylinus]QIP34385.1 transglutaminase family protein [Komagataeibacter rhaeticus]QOC46899.1 transglutaminase family protein [Komagataeibacter rhaeticus]WPP20703.1 transglutaminase family protein [Komagataeibacter rhaeticus]SAY47416.1 Transglutaminase-like superfamily protein [Komagataeibacter rhaeticus]